MGRCAAAFSRIIFGRVMKNIKRAWKRGLMQIMPATSLNLVKRNGLMLSRESIIRWQLSSIIFNYFQLSLIIVNYRQLIIQQILT